MMEYQAQYQQPHSQHHAAPHLQGAYQTSSQNAGPTVGSMTSPTGPQPHMQQQHPNHASPILPSQTQNQYQQQSGQHPSMGYPQYAVPGAGMPPQYGILHQQAAAAMATAAASGQLMRNAILRRHADRKSTRLNSSHDQISYAVFCF